MSVIWILVGIGSLLALLRLFSLRGRRNHPLLPTLRRYRYAHRGFHELPRIPENSMAAFRRAVERGWGIELDVHLLRDGALVIFHDSDLQRGTGVSGMLEDLTLPEVKALRLFGTEETIPTFDEVLALCEGKAPLIIELKTLGGNHRALVEAVCARLDRYRGTFCLESFDPYAVREVRRLRPDWCRGLLSMDFVREPGKLTHLQRRLLTYLVPVCMVKPDFVAYRFRDRRRLCLWLCTRLWGLQQVSWTIDTAEALCVCEEAGSIPIFEGFDPEDCANKP